MIAPAIAVVPFCEVLQHRMQGSRFVMAWPSQAVLWIAAGYERLVWVKSDIDTECRALAPNAKLRVQRFHRSVDCARAEGLYGCHHGEYTNARMGIYR